MKKIQIIVDGAPDLPEELLEKYNIEKIDFSVIDEKTSEEVDPKSIVERMINDPSARYKTSCPSPEKFFEVFENSRKKDIICITIGTNFSGSNNSANIGKSMFLEKYPKSNIAVIDSQLISGPMGLLVYQVGKMIEDKLKFSEIIEKIELLQKNTETHFTVAELDYLKHGGRIGGMKFLVANTLNFKPAIALQDGELKSNGVVIGTKKSMLRVVENCRKYMTGKNIDDYVVAIIGTDGGKMDEEFEAIISKHFSIREENIIRFKVGGVIASHTGPHTVALGFMKKYDIV